MIDVAEVPAAQRPIARPRSSPSKAAVMIDRLPGTRIAPNAPWRIRATIRTSIVGARPQATDGGAEADEADAERPPPP